MKLSTQKQLALFYDTNHMDWV